VPRLARLLCCGLPFAAALFWFWPALGLGFFTDDYVFPYYLDVEAGSTRWDRVVAEFTRPFFGVRDLYRPLVAVSVGVNFTFGGMDPLGFHALNVGLVAIAAAATGLAAARLLPSNARLAGLVAGLLCVLHPATVEPACWVAARSSGLEVACGSLALWSFALYARGEARSPLPPLLCCTLALLAKEGAVVVPIGMLAIDLLVGSPATLRDRWRRLLKPFLLLLAYFAFRRALLGTFTSFDEHVTPWAALQGLPAQFGHLLMPQGTVAAVLAPAIVLAMLAALLRSPRQFTVLLLWSVTALLPTSNIHAPGGGLNGRLVYAAVPILGFLLASGCTGTARLRLLGAVAACVVLASYGTAARSAIAGYARGSTEVADLGRELELVGRELAPGRPLAIASVVAGTDPVLLHPELAGLLMLRPIAARDLAAVGLTNVLRRDPQAPSLFHDASPIRAVVDAGGAVAVWRGPSFGLALTRGAPGAPVALAAEAAHPRRFRAVQPLPGKSVAVLRVDLPAPARTCSLCLLGDPTPIPFGQHDRELPAAAQRFWFDLTAAPALLLADELGKGIAGFEIEVDGAAPPAGTRVEVLAAPAPLPVPAPLLGSRLRLDELSGRLLPPRSDVPLRFVLLLPTQSGATTVPAGGVLRPDDPVFRSARFAVDVLGRVLAHGYWQTVPEHPGEPQRTPLDWFELR
jgi:hypothetical protein